MPENHSFSVENFVMPVMLAYRGKTKKAGPMPHPAIGTRYFMQFIQCARIGSCVRLAPLQRFEPPFQSFHNSLVSKMGNRRRSVFILFRIITQQGCGRLFHFSLKHRYFSQYPRGVLSQGLRLSTHIQRLRIVFLFDVEFNHLSEN